MKVPPRDEIGTEVEMKRVPLGWDVVVHVRSLRAKQMDEMSGDGQAGVVALWALAKGLEDEGINVEQMFRESPWRRGSLDGA